MSDEINAAAEFDRILADPLGILKKDDVATSSKQVDNQEKAPDTDGPAPFNPDDLPETARSEWDKLQKQLKDAEAARRELRNRVPNLQRELAAKERLLRERQKAPEPKAPAVKEGQTAADYFDSPAWKKYQDLYPEEAEPILAAFRAQEENYKRRYSELESKFGKVQSFIDNELPKRFSDYDKILEAHYANELEARAGQISDAIPDWNQHFHVSFEGGEIEIDHISDEMKEWLERQPKRMFDMLISPDVEEVTAAFSAFENWMHRKAGPSDEQRQATALQAERDKKLSRRVGPTVKGEGVARPGTLDSATAFDMRMKQLTG